MKECCQWHLDQVVKEQVTSTTAYFLQVQACCYWCTKYPAPQHIFEIIMNPVHISISKELVYNKMFDI